MATQTTTSTAPNSEQHGSSASRAGSHLPFTEAATQPYGGEVLNRTHTNASRKTTHTPKWWKIRLFRGMINDIRRRAPYYVSDWTDAWDYRVVPATIYMYFAKYEGPELEIFQTYKSHD